MRYARKLLLLVLILASLVFSWTILNSFTTQRASCLCDRHVGDCPQQHGGSVTENTTAFRINHTHPLIFIGGFPRSGTTLMRAMLDAHDDIRCGEETRVIPRILQILHRSDRQKETVRLASAGVSRDLLNSAVSRFILQIIAEHGEPAQRLCNKDPFALRSIKYLVNLFPRAKFLFMIRDGRAVAHSIITRKIKITGMYEPDYVKAMTSWNRVVEDIHSQCLEVGRTYCMKVPYEQLVLYPREWMKRILKFLDVRWDDKVLHHEKEIGKPGGVSLSKLEPSTDQVSQAIYTQSLTKWVGAIPQNVLKKLPEVSPMLGILGYDPWNNKPDYSNINFDSEYEPESSENMAVL